MKRRKYRLHPPVSPNYKSGQVLTFAASDDAPKPSEMVELIPAGPPPLVFDLKPEDDLVNAGKPLPTVELTPAPPAAAVDQNKAEDKPQMNAENADQTKTKE